MKVREIVAMLLHDGWQLVRIRGSHHHYKHQVKKGIVTVPGTGNDDLSPGTIKSIYKQAGLQSAVRKQGGST
jgi:predicted RNA binding protein YcfA (HicA-like mRNA interferase family)